MTCPSGEELVLVLDGALPEAALAEARGHVEGCASCRAELARLGAGVALLRAGSPGVEPSPYFSARLAARLAGPPVSPRGLGALLRPRWRLAAVAGVAAAAAAGLLVTQRVRVPDEFAVAERLELLEDYEVVASVGDVESAEDAEVILALDRLARRGRP